jgi:PAS domain S-box-containing protein
MGTRLLAACHETGEGVGDAERTAPRTPGEWRSHFGEILDEIADGMTIVGEDCRIQSANRAAETIFGVGRGSLIGKRCDDPALGLSEADGSPAPSERLDCCRKLQAGEAMPPTEEMIRRPDGSSVTVLSRAAPLRDVETGRFLGIVHSFTDITERKMAENALRDSEARYRRFIEASQEGVWAQDAEFRTTFVNDEMARMLGHRPEDMLGRHVVDFMFDEDMDAFRKRMRRRRKGEPSRYEQRLKRADGSPVWFRFSATPVLDRSGKFAGSFAMLTDITENKEAERVASENEEYTASLLRLYALLGRADSYSAILAALLSEVPTIVGYAGVGFGVMHEDGHSMMMLDVRGASIEKAAESILQLGGRYETGTAAEKFVRIPISGDPMMEELAEGTHIVVVEDAPTDPRTNKQVVAVGHNRTIVNVPLVLAGEILGTMVMGTFGEEGVRPPTPRQLDYLSTLANHVAVAVDRVQFLTERSRAEEALRESEERYRSLVDASPDAIVVYRRGTVIFANPAAAQVFGGPGRSSADVVGRQVIDFVHPDSRTVVGKRMLRMQQERKPLPPIEEKYVRLDGHEMIVDLAAMPVDWEGEPAVQIVARDITERKKAEEQLRALNAELEQRVQLRTSELETANEELASINEDLRTTNVEVRTTNDKLTQRNEEIAEINRRLDVATRAKSEFLANMSHELRTPLNSVLGFSSVLLQGLAGPVNEEQRRQLSMVNNAGKHLLGLINQVLDLAKVESGQLQLAVAEFDLSEFMEGVCQTVAPLAVEKKIDLICEPPKELTTMCSDRMRVEQVLINLLGNAVKFTEHGSVTLHARRADDAVVFEISDTGPGIAPDDLARVFDEFYQVPPAGVAKASGTGLGLTISKRLVDLLRGSIEVRSTVGKGSTFTVRIPVDEDRHAARS